MGVGLDTIRPVPKRVLRGLKSEHVMSNADNEVQERNEYPYIVGENYMSEDRIIRGIARFIPTGLENGVKAI